MKNKLSEEKKTILIYSGELALFSVIFLILGILKITQVIPYKESRRILLNYLSLAGALWAFLDLVWILKSQKRRAKVSLADKIAILPLTIYLLVFDYFSFFKENSEKFYVVCISVIFFYGCILYAFEAIYHYFKPIPLLLEEEDKKENKEETK